MKTSSIKLAKNNGGIHNLGKESKLNKNKGG